MALSNWATIAINEKGEATEGTFVSPLGVTVEFYKNWLSVCDRRAWEEGGAFTEPHVMHVQHGNLAYKDVRIVAFRGPQFGVYAAIMSGYEKFTAMIGCGVNGFDDADKWVGVLPESVAWFRAQLNVETDDYDIPRDLIARLDGNVKHHNQGDAYFTQNLGGDTPMSPIGETTPPLIDKIIANIKL